MKAGVILYGPPASGKDTITRELCRLDSRFEHFLRLKAGPGRTAGYRMTTEEHLQGLREAGLIVWANQRYGSTYVVDAPGLNSVLDGAIPVVHLGQAQAVPAVAAFGGASWLVVELVCPRSVAVKRITDRHTGDTEARLRVWDETRHLVNPDLRIDTTRTPAAEAAVMVIGALASDQS